MNTEASAYAAFLPLNDNAALAPIGHKRMARPVNSENC